VYRLHQWKYNSWKRERGQLSQPMTHLYEISKNESDVLIIMKCKVKNCKISYCYIKSNGLNSFKKYVDKYLTKNEKPQEHADNYFIQSVINLDGSRTHQRYDEKILSDFVWYIAHKEQSISMCYFLSFARLVI
jgi:hypothetical protein